MAREGARSKDSAKPGIKEVAAVAGVSPTTVSRVLNNRGYISQDFFKQKTAYVIVM